ncbi:hypothetical protein EYC84_004322 [Monilinia fructicola]|uniref:Uncharacterized protein n=1 Tax=Monilinia fructicola TaxID=38448 RepID=A0A5M9K3T3_MONFR|nr:hypothetical protein EYC84_004322 [Monilinia fructicola]
MLRRPTPPYSPTPLLSYSHNILLSYFLPSYSFTSIQYYYFLPFPLFCPPFSPNAYPTINTKHKDSLSCCAFTLSTKIC